MAFGKRKRTPPSHTLFTVVMACMLLDPVTSDTSKLLDPGVHPDSSTQLFIQDRFTFVHNTTFSCEDTYLQYLQAVENFTHCEIHKVNPFKLCLSCKDQFLETDKLFLILNSDPKHEPCKIKYMMSDRVQVILTVQTNIDKMWRSSHCHRCYSKNETLRERVEKFLELHDHYNQCVNGTTNLIQENIDHGKSELGYANTSDICLRCKNQYALLNSKFNEIYEADKGDVCMDIMNMMNNTRLQWSLQLNCTKDSYDAAPVIVISCIVACTPILFYVYVRITAEVRFNTLFKPKRLITKGSRNKRITMTTGNSVNED